MVRLLDHVGIVGGEVGALRVAWERLGFAMTAPRPLLGRTTEGTAVPLGQWSCHAVLDGGYVELTAVDPGVASHHLDPWRRHGDGGWIVAFGAADADSARERADQCLGFDPSTLQIRGPSLAEVGQDQEQDKERQAGENPGNKPDIVHFGSRKGCCAIT